MKRGRDTTELNKQLLVKTAELEHLKKTGSQKEDMKEILNNLVAYEYWEYLPSLKNFDKNFKWNLEAAYKKQQVSFPYLFLIE